MNNVFNYQTLNVKLAKETRTLYITFRSINDTTAITMETLFEFESLLAWVTSRVEIHSIIINSDSAMFSAGYNQKILSKLTIEKLQKFTSKLQKINQAIMLLPQTIICDLGSGARNIACELATACDIRVAHKSCSISFDHAKLGIIPCSGGIAQLSCVVGQANTRNWLLTGKEIRLSKLENSGYVFESYSTDSKDEVILDILTSISQQAPVQRIQTKLGVVENIRDGIEKMTKFESQIAQASMMSEDWKKDNKSLGPIPAKSMARAVKLSLVKSEGDLET